MYESYQEKKDIEFLKTYYTTLALEPSKQTYDNSIVHLDKNHSLENFKQYCQSTLDHIENCVKHQAFDFVQQIINCLLYTSDAADES